MEVRPHDLLLIDGPDALVNQTTCPLWVSAALERAPYVVVRRQRASTGMVAVGVRGQTRSERYAAFLPTRAIRQQITPEQLAQAQGWITSPRLSTSQALQALITVSDVLETWDLAWGPVGSVGFELASDRPTITESSDLDVIIRAPERLSLALARTLLARLSSLPVRVDIQVETPFGAFALQEYGREASRVMVRTPDGPRLLHDAWEHPEQVKGTDQ
ncbi:MAG TPA: malonate decarboxylase holo-ACP synthase [Ktedonobacteraceae bacterium]|jgi:phosphoribosyl-dephospho-CoA transferase|nr:malonate decarboxylase holo-ACP synthase [Ktedonobacteraceae bacterium]